MNSIARLRAAHVADGPRLRPRPLTTIPLALRHALVATTDAVRPNVLLVGSRRAAQSVLASVWPFLRQPVRQWPREVAPWCDGTPLGTLLLDRVDALDDTNQDRLYHWLQTGGRGVQVVSIVDDTLSRRVGDGTFCTDLYDRLNAVSVECGGLQHGTVVS